MSARQAPAFDTAALSIATVDAACVPGGCGGLVVDADGVTRHPSGIVTFTFDQPGDFDATYAAQRCLRDAGFSVGHTQRGAPRGILFGDFNIQKWRNLNQAERDALHGTLTGDGRMGPITVSLRANCPPHARAALTAALSNGETS